MSKIIRVNSLEEMRQSMRGFEQAYRDNAGMSLWQEVSLIMNESQDECPVEFGILKASGYVEDPQIIGGNASVKLGYSAEYAIYVHENLSAYHAPPTKAKFLEDPVRRSMPGFANRVGERLKGFLAEGLYR